MSLLTSFSNLFKGRYSLLANTITGAILFIVGDTIEQRLEVKAKTIPEFDNARLTRIGLIGLSEGPTHQIFYTYLDKFLPGKTMRTVGKKVLADQLIACPIFNFQFFMGMSLLEGKDLTQCWQEFRRKFPTVYVVDWMVWPPCQAINFLLVPNRFRILYVNGVTVAWNVFLSYMKHYDQHGPKQQQ